MPRGARTIALWLGVSMTGVLGGAGRVEADGPCTPMPIEHRPAATNAERPPDSTLTIASLNIAGQPRIKDALVNWVQQRHFDIVLLQEVGEHAMDGSTFITEIGERLGYHVAYAPATVFGDTEKQGLAILSRDPISDIRTVPLTYHRLRFKSRCRIGLAATVATAAGAVRVINVHLDTRINSKERVAQLAPVIDALGAADGPQIVGGD